MAIIITYSMSGAQTATYAAVWGEVVMCDPTGGGFTVNLPTAVGNSGRQIIVKNDSASTNTITIEPDGSETIDGAANTTITTARGTVRITSDGTNLIII
jgi:hypothetical protein